MDCPSLLQGRPYLESGAPFIWKESLHSLKGWGVKDTLLLSQALVFNIPYRPSHDLSPPARALMWQLTRSQLILCSLQFRLMPFDEMWQWLITFLVHRLVPALILEIILNNPPGIPGQRLCTQPLFTSLLASPLSLLVKSSTVWDTSLF